MLKDLNIPSSKIKNRLIRFSLIAFTITFIWNLTILFYTKGRILVGGDWVGYYDAFSAIKTGIPNAIIYGIGLLLAKGNVYIGFYLGISIGLFLNIIALFYFLNKLFADWQSRVSPYIIAGIFYSFNMFALYNTFKSIVGIAEVANAGVLIFFAQIIKFYRYIIAGAEFSKWDCILMGIGIAVSSRVPPNSFRILLAESIVMVILFAYAFIKGYVRKIFDINSFLRKFLNKLLQVISIALLGMLYWEIPFFSTFKESIETAFYAMHAKSYLNVLNAPYAKLINVFRILGVWAFPTGYCPYHMLYYHDPLITVTSFMWPIMALGLPMLLAEKKERSQILILISFSLAIISWDMADNPPVGPLNKFIVTYFPLILGFFPTYFLSGTFLPLIYVVLATFTTVKIIEFICHMLRKDAFKIRNKFLKTIFSSLLVFLLIIPSIPFFNGSALGQYFDPNIKGIWIPEEYFDVKNVVLQYQGAILIWPSLTTYIQTSWGYQGAANFYNEFFAPKNIITPQNPIFKAGGYTFFNPSSRNIYINLSKPPLKPGVSWNIKRLIDEKHMQIWGASYEVSGDIIKITISDSDHIDIVLPFLYAVNISNFQFLVLELSFKPSSYMEDLAALGGFWVGVLSADGMAGWYICGSSSNTYFVVNSSISIFLLINYPDKPWPASYYNSSNIVAIIIRLFTHSFKKYDEVFLSLKSIKIAFSDIDFSIINIWKRFKIKYILFDKSLVDGAYINPKIYDFALDRLKKEKILRPVFLGKYIELYEIEGINS